jgi:hypothetical protein
MDGGAPDGHSGRVMPYHEVRRHNILTGWRMKLEEWMSIWELKGQTPMGMEKK